MLRGAFRAFSTMSRDPAFPILLEECTSLSSSSWNSSSSSKKKWISVALNLLEEDHTVPFIARYRREQTGDIPVNDLYELQRKWTDFLATIKLRTSRLSLLESSGRCTAEVKKAFMECTSKEELDELYASFKEVKTAKSELINAFSVDAVADSMLEGKEKFYLVTQDASDIAKTSKYSVFEAISYHCAAVMFSDLSIKASAKEQFGRHPTVVTTSLTTAYKALQKNSSDGNKALTKPKTSKTGESVPKLSELIKYKEYHSVNRRITQLAAHQLLAIRRGKEAGVLAINLSPDNMAKDLILRFINNKYNVFVDFKAVWKESHKPNAERVGDRISRHDVLVAAAKDAVSKFCASLTKKQWKEAITAAEIEAAEVFSSSLRPLLLTAPLRTVLGDVSNGADTIVCAVDPGFAHGHKWVILTQGSSTLSTAEGVQAQGDETKILCYGKIFENSSGKHSSGSHSSPMMLSSPAQLSDVLVRFKVTAIAIGNGTGSREAQAFVSAALDHAQGKAAGATEEATSTAAAASGKDKKKRKHDDHIINDVSSSSSNNTSKRTGVPSRQTGCVGYAVVSEAGASVYSASDRAREEFPPAMLDIAYVGAVSIGRRLVDPLSELIKVQPASLGVGMYQHDLSDKGITDRLRNVVEDCVNVVGVDVNTASADLLRYVSGLNDSNVREIMAHRSSSGTSDNAVAKKSTKKSQSAGAAQGRLDSLADLRGVKGIGPKTFSNCAGFLRVYDGSEPLDRTNIHPDDYALAREMLKIFAREGQGSSETIEPETKRAKKEVKEAKGKKDQADKDDSGDEVAVVATAGDIEAPLGDSFWAQRLSAVAAVTAPVSAGSSKSTKDPYALLRGKSSADLDQIWAWLQEASLAPQSKTSRQLSKGPYMSQPKLLQRLPADFQNKIEVGSIVHGVVRNVTTFGAFVDLGGVEIHTAEGKSKPKASCDGLLHSSKYRDYVNKRAAAAAAAAVGGTKSSANAAMSMATDIYVGREIKVKILSIEDSGDGGGKSDGHDKRRISLDLLDLI